MGLDGVWAGVWGGWMGLLVLAVGCAVWPRLSARFDRRVLVVTAPGLALNTPQAAPALDLAAPTERWCTQGLGHGALPWWAPLRRPVVDLPVAFATLQTKPNHPMPAWIQTLADRLDGTEVLAALPSPQHKFWYRLQVKWCDVRWWRPRQPTDPWDCGYLQPQATLADVAAFRPRRATLVVVLGLPPQPLMDLVRTIQTESTAYRQPVRLLLTDAHAHNTLAQAGVPHQVLDKILNRAGGEPPRPGDEVA
jgi:hypothetical protein